MRRDGTLLFTPRQVFLPLGAACAGGMLVIAVLGRDPTVTYAAIASFGAAVLISVLLALRWSAAEGRIATAKRIVAVAALGASAALPGWCFGPSSAYAGILALILLFTGLLMGGVGTPYPRAAAWSVYVALAAGQLVVATLIFTDVLRDVSLLPLLPTGAPLWHHVAAHVTVQLVYAAAFGIGRALHERYWNVTEELDASTRAAARRDALLDEARAEYRRMFALRGNGIFAGHTVGRFRLGELIGRGGVGEVYEACDLDDGSRVAVKLLRSDRLDDPAALQDLLEEATVLTRISSPHVVHSIEVGGLDAIMPYVAMERLDGRSLADRVAGGPLDRNALRALVDHACQALAVVHAAGICHGDLQPRNLIEGATWKLIDFGNRRGGTPRFAAPEVMSGGAPTPASDIYSLCACLYVALTGREPFGEVAPGALAHEMARRLPIDPQLNSALSDALAIGLAPDPTQRHADATALRSALLAALDDAAPAPRGPSWSPVPAEVTARAVAPLPVEPVALERSVMVPGKDVATVAWSGAFADKMRLQYACVLAACIVGAALIGLVVRDPAMLAIGFGTIAAAALLVLYERAHEREWPWVVVAALAIGPSYVLGLHCGFAAVIAVTLFIESSFRSSPRGITGRGWILVAVLITHASAFAMIHAHWIPDGHVTHILHHAPPWTGLLVEVLVLGIYVLAFALGHVIYARHSDLVTRNAEAARGAAHQEALLATARAEIDRVLAGYAGGLFTGSRIGSYTVHELIGRGGMGEVYAAERGAGGRIALKVLRADRLTDETSLHRFMREGEALQRIDSPYVARVLEVGTEDGQLPYLAMELVAGTSLAERLRTCDRLDLAAARALMRDITRGLADVHAAGVVHRDVKPQNLMLTDDGARWKLVDFGIAKHSDATISTEHAIVGTPAYMAPEHLAGARADARADLYSLALVLFRVLAGRPAFANARTPVQRPPDPYVLDVPRDLRHFLRIALATSAEDRFSTALELHAAFEAACSGLLDDALRARARTLAAREPW